MRVSPWTRSNTGCWRRVLLARAGVGQGGGTSAARLLTCTCVTSVLVPGPDHCTGDHRALPTVHWRLEATLQLKLLLTTLHVTLTGESLPHSAGGTLLHCSSQMSMCVSYRYLLAEKTGNEGIHLSSLNINTYLARCSIVKVHSSRIIKSILLRVESTNHTPPEG